MHDPTKWADDGFQNTLITNMDFTWTSENLNAFRKGDPSAFDAVYAKLSKYYHQIYESEKYFYAITIIFSH